MNIDLEQQLYNFGPILYQEKDLSMNQTCMCWGFECPDEWFSLLKDLTIKIEEINNKYKGQYEYIAHQVKEKFGSLRFYGEIKILIENCFRFFSVLVGNKGCKLFIICSISI